MEKAKVDYSDLLCLLCANIVKKPLCLSKCSHSFCETCITQYLTVMKLKKESPKCPQCSVKFKVTEVKKDTEVFKGT